MNGPNLFIVGEQKCGTTALYYFLEEHPDIFMSDPKDPDYFCIDLHRESDRYHGWKMYFPIREEKKYLRLFKSSKNEKVLGDASGSYIYSKVAAENIYHFNPDAKIIIMIRELVDFLYSLHSEMVYGHHENIEDFKEALLSEEKRKKGKQIPKRVSFPSALYYSERVKYYEHIKRYTDIFKKNQIKIILFDDFKQNNSIVYKEVLKFLNVAPNFIPEFKSININKIIRFKTLKYVIESPLVWRLPKKLLPKKLYDEIAQLFFRITMRYEPKHPLDTKLRNELKEKYRLEVIELNKFLNKEMFIKKDLVKLWGYV